jgi:hypothetical protein
MSIKMRGKEEVAVCALLSLKGHKQFRHVTIFENSRPSLPNPNLPRSKTTEVRKKTASHRRGSEDTLESLAIELKNVIEKSKTIKRKRLTYKRVVVLDRLKDIALLEEQAKELIGRMKQLNKSYFEDGNAMIHGAANLSLWKQVFVTNQASYVKAKEW